MKLQYSHFLEFNHTIPIQNLGSKGGGPVIDMGPYYLTALVNHWVLLNLLLAHVIIIQKRIIGIGPKKGKGLK